jgi:hypothetical protein
VDYVEHINHFLDRLGPVLERSIAAIPNEDLEAIQSAWKSVGGDENDLGMNFSAGFAAIGSFASNGIQLQFLSEKAQKLVGLAREWEQQTQGNSKILSLLVYRMPNDLTAFVEHLANTH